LPNPKLPNPKLPNPKAPNLRSGRAACTSLFTLALCAAAVPVAAQVNGGHSADAGNGAIGIRLAEIPANRMDDPRAHLFIDDHVNPGTTFTRGLRVYSTSAKPQHLTVYAAAASISDHRFTFAPGSTGNELTSWIKLDHSQLNLAPHSSAPIKVTVAVPSWAAEGERLAVIWAQVSSAAAAPKANVALVNRVGIRTYLDVGPGGEPPSDFRTDQIHTRRTPSGRPEVVATVTNTGQRAIDLSGQLLLSDGPSSVSAAGPFPVVRGTTLAPKEHGQITVPLGRNLPTGRWRYRLTLQSGRVKHTMTGSLDFSPVIHGGLALFGYPVGAVTLALGGVTSAALTLLIPILVRSRSRRRIRATHPRHDDLG
jgi:hypothetical protein